MQAASTKCIGGIVASIAAFQAVDPASISSQSFHKAGPKSILNSFCDIWLRQKLLDGSFDSRKGLALPVFEPRSSAWQAEILSTILTRICVCRDLPRQRHCPDITKQSMSFSYAGPAPYTITYQLDHHELKSLSIWNAAMLQGSLFLMFFFLISQIGAWETWWHYLDWACDYWVKTFFFFFFFLL